MTDSILFLTNRFILIKNASRYLVGGMVDKDDEGSYYTFLVNKKELAHYLRLRTDWELESHGSTIFYKKLIGGITDAKNFAVRKYKRQKGSPR